MILAVCIDDRNGMLFNGRRQSQDRVLREDLVREAGGGPLWMNAYSAGQFAKEDPVTADEDFLEKAGPGDACFAEGPAAAEALDRAEKLVLYRWNRKYPAGLYCTIGLSAWKLERREEFAGSSHEKITKEVYKR